MTQLTKGIFTNRSITLNGSAQLLAAADPSRTALVVSNPAGSAKLAIGFDSSVALNTGGYITMNAAATIVLDKAIPTNDIYVIGTNAQACTCFTFP